MTISPYPITLPAPIASPLTLAERRRVGDGPIDLRAAYTEWHGTRELAFPPMAAEQAASFMDWWRLTLGEWFVASWPLLSGVHPAQYRFTEAPSFRYIPLRTEGGGWHVEVTAEVRGHDPNANDLGSGLGHWIWIRGKLPLQGELWHWDWSTHNRQLDGQFTPANYLDSTVYLTHDHSVDLTSPGDYFEVVDAPLPLMSGEWEFSVTVKLEQPGAGGPRPILYQEGVDPLVPSIVATTLSVALLPGPDGWRVSLSGQINSSGNNFSHVADLTAVTGEWVKIRGRRSAQGTWLYVDEQLRSFHPNLRAWGQDENPLLRPLVPESTLRIGTDGPGSTYFLGMHFEELWIDTADELPP